MDLAWPLGDEPQKGYKIRKCRKFMIRLVDFMIESLEQPAWDVLDLGQDFSVNII